MQSSRSHRRHAGRRGVRLARSSSAMATRVLAGDIFGLEKMVPWGTQIHSQLVGDYQEKSLCIAQISRVRRADGRAPQVSRGDRAVHRRDADERALRRAGRRARQADLRARSRRRRASRCASSRRSSSSTRATASTFAVAVRDAFGTLERSTVLRYLLQVPARRAADRSQGRRRGPRPVPDGQLGDDGLLQRAAGRRDRGGVRVRPRDAEAAARAVRLLHREDRRGAAGSPPVQSRRLPARGHPVERRRAPRAAASPPRGLDRGARRRDPRDARARSAVVAWPRLFPAHEADAGHVHDRCPRARRSRSRAATPAPRPTAPLVVRGLEVGRAYPVVAQARRLRAEDRRSCSRSRRRPRSRSSSSRRTSTVVLDTQPHGRDRRDRRQAASARRR